MLEGYIRSDCDWMNWYSINYLTLYNTTLISFKLLFFCAGADAALEEGTIKRRELVVRSYSLISIFLFHLLLQFLIQPWNHSATNIKTWIIETIKHKKKFKLKITLTFE
jgi:hypothetical protein